MIKVTVKFWRKRQMEIPWTGFILSIVICFLSVKLFQSVDRSRKCKAVSEQKLKLKSVFKDILESEVTF